MTSFPELLELAAQCLDLLPLGFNLGKRERDRPDIESGDSGRELPEVVLLHRGPLSWRLLRRGHDAPLACCGRTICPAIRPAKTPPIGRRRSGVTFTTPNDERTAT